MISTETDFGGWIMWSWCLCTKVLSVLSQSRSSVYFPSIIFDGQSETDVGNPL